MRSRSRRALRDAPRRYKAPRALAIWTGAQVVPTAGSKNRPPTFVLTDQAGGLTPGAFIGRRLELRSGNGFDDRGVISANDATTLTCEEDGVAAYLEQLLAR